MADTIERTIYKLEIDDSGYIRGVENMSASTRRFAEVQQASNRALEILEQTLKEQSSELAKAKSALESYTGADEKHRQQLQKTFNDQKANNDKLRALVVQARTEYEKATKAAQDFANTSARANQLQGQPGARIAPQIPSAPAGISAQIFNAIDLTEMAELAEVTANTKQEFEELADAIALAEARLNQLDPATEEFKQLAPIVEQGKKALQEYDAATKKTEESGSSLRTQLRNARDELTKLEIAGKATTKEYIELEKRTAKLSDAFQDQQQRIKILASDTKLLDFGKGAITAATSAFQAYTAVSILAGDESEELQKKTMQLFAAMQLLQSLEQLSNLTRREGALATLAQSAAQSTYTAVVGASTGALRAFRLALAATGVGAIIVGIALLVNKYQQLAEAQREAERESRLLNEVQKEVAQSAGSEIAQLQILYKVATNTTLSLKERKKAVDDLQKQYPDYFKDIKDEIILQGQAAGAYDATKAAILESAKARAIESKLGKLASDELDKEQEKENIRRAQEKNRLEQQKADRKDARDAEARGLDQFNAKVKKNDLNTQLENVNKDLAGIAKDRDFLLNQITKAPTKETPAPGGRGDREVENEFAKRLRDLQAKLAEVTAKSFESEGTIRKQFEASLTKEISEINALSKAKLTDKQKVIIIDLITKINDVQLQEALDQFNKKVTDARNKLNDDIRALQLQNTEESIQLLQDEFERRRQLIDFNEREALAETERNTAERLAALEEQRDLVGEQVYQDAKNRIVQAGEDAQTNIIIQASQERQQLAADSFRDSLKIFEGLISEADLVDDQDSAKKIRELSNQFLRQKITFEQFQKDLEKIEKDYAAKKRNRDLAVYKDELTQLDIQIARTEDKTSKHYQELLRLRDDLAKKIAAKETEDAVKDAGDQNEDTPRPVSTIVEYANSIGQLADSIVQFWQTANDAETAALERSIALQERRVDAAQRIAERGNAQYLKAEEDRLRELEIARENAARRQLAIDAALQASQVLVGITGAIAKIATPGIGIAETIGAIAVIVGALATGYGIVKSLQGNQPRLFKGTKYLEREGHPSGRDTIPAMLNEGEAVIPTDVNKKYHPAISAIYDKKIPPEVINNFVKNYHTIKPVPQPNYQRIKDAAEINVSHDGKMAVILSEHSNLLRENNRLQTEILRKQIKVENKIDKDGVSSMVYEYLEQQRVSKHT